MSNTALKKVIAFTLAAFILFAAYYGTYLPMRKSQVFILAMRSISSSETLEDLKSTVAEPLMINSPIGQEELVRNFANMFLRIVQSTGDAEAISQLIDFITQYFKPIIERGRGMSFGQNLYILGAMNEAAFVKTKQIRYLEDSKLYYIKALELGPKRPQPLYGLFDVYRLEGNVEKSKEIFNQIISQWPNEERAKQGLAEFLEQVDKLKEQSQPR